MKLSPIYQNGMIFQRGKEIVVTGNTSEKTVSCTLVREDGTYRESVTVYASETGDFKVTLPPAKAGAGYTLIVGDITLSDILVGDIWLAGGQSNMEFFMKYEKDYEKIKALKKNPLIRMYNVVQTGFEGHAKPYTGYGKWFKQGEDGFENFSAPGFSFAYHIQESLDVPIGIIGCNWGGSSASTWVPKSVLERSELHFYLDEYEDACAQYSPEEMKRISLEGWAFEDSPQHGVDFEPIMYGRDWKWQLDYMREHDGEPVIPMGPYNFNRPSNLYERMLSPLFSFPIKGVIWYQGESDCGERAPFYDLLFEGLVDSWRKGWNDPALPFITVQLAPFGVWLSCDSNNYVTVRERQHALTKKVPGVYMASIMDIGSYYDIHPKQKWEVGRRLSLLAKGHVYGENIVCESPEYTSYQIVSEDKIALTFDFAKELHMNGEQTDITCSLQDGTVLPIYNFALEGNKILLQIPSLSQSVKSGKEVTISLGWADYAQIHVWNEENLPVKPFRITI